MKTESKAVDIDRNKGDFRYDVEYAKDAGYGLSEKTIHYISDVKEDPDWVREFRLRGLKTFLEKPLPTHWASKDLETIDFDKIRYYLSSGMAAKRSWDDVPEDIKRLVPAVLAHRILLTPDAHLHGHSVEDVLARVLNETAVPSREAVN